MNVKLTVFIVFTCLSTYTYGQKSDLSEMVKELGKKMRESVGIHYDSTKGKRPLIFLDDKSFPIDSLYKYEIKDISKIAMELEGNKILAIYGLSGRFGVIRLYLKKK